MRHYCSFSIWARRKFQSIPEQILPEDVVCGLSDVVQPALHASNPRFDDRPNVKAQTCRRMSALTSHLQSDAIIGRHVVRRLYFERRVAHLGMDSLLGCTRHGRVMVCLVLWQNSKSSDEKSAQPKSPITAMGVWNSKLFPPSHRPTMLAVRGRQACVALCINGIRFIRRLIARSRPGCHAYGTEV